jgi:hypothetical protein
VEWKATSHHLRRDEEAEENRRIVSLEVGSENAKVNGTVALKNDGCHFQREDGLLLLQVAEVMHENHCVLDEATNQSSRLCHVYAEDWAKASNHPFPFCHHHHGAGGRVNVSCLVYRPDGVEEIRNENHCVHGDGEV